MSRPALTRARAALAAVLAPALAAVALAGCAAPSAQDALHAGRAAGAPSADGAFPVTLEHAYGETTIGAEPQRVVAWDWSTQDAVIGLGVAPVAMTTYTYGGDDEGVLPWTADALAEQGLETPQLLTYGAEVPFEEIAAAEPDVILAVNSGLTEGDYATLSQIAPTVVQPGDPYVTPWQEQVELVGAALGRSAQAEELVAETSAAITAQAEANPELAGATFAYASGDVSTGQLSLYVPGDVRVQLLTELGMELSPYVEQNAPGDGAFSYLVSLEQADQVSSDVLVAWFGDQAAVDAFTADPLVQRVPAVASGAFAPVVGESFVMATSAVSALSIPWALEDYVPLLAEAVRASGRSSGSAG